jgi:putative transposase
MGCAGRWARPGSAGTTAQRSRSGSTFKHEDYYRHVYATKTELVAAVDKWIGFYNSTRRHSAIGMLSPDDYEKSLRLAA